MSIMIMDLISFRHTQQSQSASPWCNVPSERMVHATSSVAYLTQMLLIYIILLMLFLMTANAMPELK